MMSPKFLAQRTLLFRFVPKLRYSAGRRDGDLSPAASSTVVRTLARPGRGGTLLNPKVTAGLIGASAPASAPFQLTTAELMWCRSLTP